MALEIYTYKQYAAVARYTGNERNVLIPAQHNGVPVTEIRASAFAHNREIEAVFIPSTLQVIGADAFANCHKLKFVGCGMDDISENDLASLSEDERPDLDAITEESLPVLSLIPASVREVESGAFAETGILNIEFKGIDLTIGDAAFKGCPSLEMVAMFNCTQLSLGKQVFMNSSITRFYAPGARLETLPEYTFANCKRLISALVRINAVGSRAFYHCEKLKRLEIPKDLRRVGREAFEGCDQLDSAKLPKKPPKAPSIDPALWPYSPKPSVHLPDEAPAAPVQEAAIADKPLHTLLSEIGGKESPPVQEAAKDAESDGLGQPLFQMQIDYRGKRARTLPSKLKGCWGRGDGTFYFSIQSPSSLYELGMRILPGQSLEKLSPVMDYIVNKSMTVSLLGKQTGDIYWVYQLSPCPSTHEKSISQEFLDKIIERINRPIPENVELGEMVQPFAMRTEEEYKAFLEICSSKLPSWVLRAYKANEETILRSTGRSSEEERKHARRAQELLMNIDWLPYAVNIPPAKEVRRILDEEFHGLEAVKQQIMEVAAEIRRSGKLPKYGILLNGPAGTGKTSIAKAIARVFGMQLIRLDIPTIGDSADEISGSSRIYSNARPGMLLESMFQIRSSTAVLLANEVDKAGQSKGGRCASDLLLSILDKTDFYENFLEVAIPTDNIFCIGTCNDLSSISKPLQDRFYIINISAYTTEEKKIIFRDYVLPQAKAQRNIGPEQMGLEEEAVNLLVSKYALEEGARDLEKYAQRFAGNYCLSAEEAAGGDTKRLFTSQDVRDLFGMPKIIYRHIGIMPGEINAAFYHDGKAHFFLMEASVSPGTGKFRVLGPMTQIQKDYCEVAYLCVRNTVNATAYDFSTLDVTVFVPQPIPDDSKNYVGFACYAAICSKLLNVNLALDKICFIGACDMYGSLYFEESDLTPMLQAMKAQGISTLYAPMGANRLVYPKVNSDCQIMIVEAPDAKTLFSLAVAQSNPNH